MFRLGNKVFIALLSFSGLLPSLAKASDRTKCTSINNKPLLTRPTLIDLYSNELHHYQFMASLDRCNERCNTLDNFSCRTCVPNKTKDVKC